MHGHDVHRLVREEFQFVEQSDMGMANDMIMTDIVTRFFFQYLAIYNNGKLPQNPRKLQQTLKFCKIWSHWSWCTLLEVGNLMLLPKVFGACQLSYVYT